MRRKVPGICWVQTRTPLVRSKQLRTRMRGVFEWLRGLDLNQRPLGYEPNGQLLSPIDFNAFSSGQDPEFAQIQPVLDPSWTLILGRSRQGISATTPCCQLGAERPFSFSVQLYRNSRFIVHKTSSHPGRMCGDRQLVMFGTPVLCNHFKKEIIVPPRDRNRARGSAGEFRSLELAHDEEAFTSTWFIALEKSDRNPE